MQRMATKPFLSLPSSTSWALLLTFVGYQVVSLSFQTSRAALRNLSRCLMIFLKGVALVMLKLVNFTVGYFSGRSLKHLVSAFAPLTGDRLTPSTYILRSLCAYAKQMITSLPSRRHDVNFVVRPVVVFTDGACERENATVGAVIIDGSERETHSILVPDSLISHWLQEAGDQIISQIELWASVILRWHFRERLCNRRIIAWIDNEAARACAVKANSPSPTMKAMARILGDIDVTFPTMSWFERVCSFLNPSDLPSRGKVMDAVSSYGLTDCGTLIGDQELLDRVLQLTHDPYHVASTTSGANN